MTLFLKRWCKDIKISEPAILILTQLSPFVKIELLLVVFLRRIFIIEVEYLKRQNNGPQQQAIINGIVYDKSYQ